MNAMTRIPRSRGVLSGVLLILLGAWGGLIPFVGPYFHYAYTPDSSWTFTASRLWLEVLPGVATMLAGLIVTATSSRAAAQLASLLAGISGVWFAIGIVIGRVWWRSQLSAGTPVGGNLTRALEQIGFFTGLGLVIVLLAALTFGRASVVGVREATAALAKPVRSKLTTTSATPALRRMIPVPMRRKVAASSRSDTSSTQPTVTSRS
jgi:hypothetical protein